MAVASVLPSRVRYFVGDAHLVSCASFNSVDCRLLATVSAFVDVAAFCPATRNPSSVGDLAPFMLNCACVAHNVIYGQFYEYSSGISIYFNGEKPR
jgi:uncharacterized membrane protein